MKSKRYPLDERFRVFVHVFKGLLIKAGAGNDYEGLG